MCSHINSPSCIFEKKCTTSIYRNFNRKLGAWLSPSGCTEQTRKIPGSLWMAECTRQKGIWIFNRRDAQLIQLWFEKWKKMSGGGHRWVCSCKILECLWCCVAAMTASSDWDCPRGSFLIPSQRWGSFPFVFVRLAFLQWGSWLPTSLLREQLRRSVLVLLKKG